VKSSNPVLSRLGQTAEAERRANGGGYAPAGYGQYGQSPAGPMQSTRTMTLDDVVIRTVGLVALVVVAAALSWWGLKDDNPATWVFAGASSIAGFVLVLVISFKRITNPIVISLYAILQGIVLGIVSRAFEHAYPGIVVQAVGATLAVFLGMAVLFKFRVIRATPRFARWVIGALIGVVGLSLVNWILSAFGHNLGIQYYTPTDKGGTLAIIFSLVCIGVGALTFILDFDAVEKGIQYGLPERYAWYCAFGLVVGLIYLYWQILRLLGYLRN
jgi:uncharacterized YccA/Bax inhibitor family protein